MTACSGGDTEIEVIQEPETVQEPIQEPEPTEEAPLIPEPVVETGYLPTLESWGIEDGELEIVNGNCNLPIFRKVPFPSTVPLERIRNWMPIIGGGPYCLDDDDEGSTIETPHGTKPSGLGNFYDNVFSRKSGWYFNDRGEVRLHGNSRSFIMVTTHINARGGGDVRVAKGKLFGAYRGGLIF